jgi:Plasmid pRiA4b ORF-3-like protein
MAQPPRKKHRSSANVPCLYTLHIELEPDEIHPPIWRRLAVDGRVSLGKLHHFIQAAFGWTDSHLHYFMINGQEFGTPRPDDAFGDEETQDERKAFLNRLVATGQSFVYRYDFGDDWQHLIMVESVDESPSEDPAGGAWIVNGGRACPPEDVGGAPGYGHFLDTLRDAPDSDEAQDLRNWAGGAFDPELFDRRAANATITRMLWNRWGGK